MNETNPRAAGASRLALTPLTLRRDSAAARLLVAPTRDERYRLCSATAVAAARGARTLARIARFGVLAPPLVVERGDAWVAVSGFAELAALDELAAAELPVLVAHAPSDLEALVLAAECIAHEREPSPFEAARAVQRGRDAGIEREELVARLLPALGLAPHRAVYKNLRELAAVPPALAARLEEAGVSSKRALRFAGIDAEQAALLGELMAAAAPSAQALEELRRLLDELGRRDAAPWREVAERLGLVEVLAEAALSPADKLKRWRQRLWDERYPAWAAARRAASERLAEWALPEGARVEWDPSFEREGLRLTLDVRTVEQWRADLESLASDESIKGLQRLLDAL